VHASVGVQSTERRVTTAMVIAAACCIETAMCVGSCYEVHADLKAKHGRAHAGYWSAVCEACMGVVEVVGSGEHEQREVSGVENPQQREVSCVGDHEHRAS
jgi:hypothetical protein